VLIGNIKKLKKKSLVIAGDGRFQKYILKCNLLVFSTILSAKTVKDGYYKKSSWDNMYENLTDYIFKVKILNIENVFILAHCASLHVRGSVYSNSPHHLP